MRSALRTNALRGIPPATAVSSPTGPLRSSSSGVGAGVKSLRGVNGRRMSGPSGSASGSGSGAAYFHATAVQGQGQAAAQEGGEVVAVGTGGGGKVEMEEGELPRRTRVTLAEVRERRARKGRLVAPTAAPCDAGMFMGPVCYPFPLVTFFPGLSILWFFAPRGGGGCGYDECLSSNADMTC